MGVDDVVEGGPQGNFVGRIEPGSAADKSGLLKVGDEIHAVDGVAVRNLPHIQCLTAFRVGGKSDGPIKTSVTLVVARNEAGWKRFLESTKMPNASVRQVGASTTARTKPTPVPQHVNGADGSRPSSIDIHRFTLSTSVAEVEEAIAAGITALYRGWFEDAEQMFLKALHPVLDPSIQAAIVNASKLPVDQAREECRRIVQLEQQRKGGVHYLLGISLLYQQKQSEGTAALLTAANQTVSWLCLDGMTINPDDSTFHHTMSQSLVSVSKFNIAMIALEEACMRAPLQKQWLDELNTLRRRHGLEPAARGAQFPRGPKQVPDNHESDATSDSPPANHDPLAEPNKPENTPLLTNAPTLTEGDGAVSTDEEKYADAVETGGTSQKVSTPSDLEKSDSPTTERETPSNSTQDVEDQTAIRETLDASASVDSSSQ